MHLLLLTAIWFVPARMTRDDDRPRKIDVVFYAPRELPATPPARPEPPAPEPVAVAQARLPPAPPRERPAVPPVVRDLSRPEVERPKVVERRADRAAEAPMAPTGPAVRRETRVGAFGGAPRQAAAPRDSGVVATRPAGFGTAAVTPAVAGDETPPVVAHGGFGDSRIRVPAERRAGSGAVVTAGFEGIRDGQGAEPAARGTVQQGGFGDHEPVAPRQSRRRAQPAPDLETPVEIVSKPAPVYTEEARRLRIEGEVVLRVTFVADGRLQVLEVVDGLGHGLDHAAVEAAEKIRFKPARRHGRPVDHTATLRVVFRLA